MIYGISDLHLCLSGNKPMEVFGDGWTGYLDKVRASWQEISDDDVVLLAGDLSWAMHLEDARADFAFLSSLPGKKIITRGNHDYWWSSYNKVKLAIPPSVTAIQNNAVRIDGAVVCGSRGYLVPNASSTEDDVRIFNREMIRLEMALTEAHKLLQDDDRLIVMVHYPPFVGKFEPTPFTKLFNDYRVDTVVYGHIHGKNSFHRKYAIINGIEYILTSTDMVDHCLVPIL